MKVLILSCNTGEGHNSSAKALKNTFEERGIEAEVQDTVSLVSEEISRGLSDIYVFSTKNSLFERIYKIGGAISDIEASLKSPVYFANKLYAKKLYDFIVNGHYDAVICVHLFPAEAITALKRNAHLDVPAIFVATDYTVYPFLHETELDRYVVAHEDVVEEHVLKGVPREKILPYGIPVDKRKFTSRMEKNAARRMVEKEFGWETSEEDSHWYLIMSGSMGFGNLDDLVAELIKKTAGRDRIICVCGRNEKTREKLDEEFKTDPQFRAIGYTDKVSQLMDASDVLFSKPGGITSTEALVKNIPLVHTAPIPGLEESNARFFHYHNLSYSSLDSSFQADVAIRLCEDEAYRRRMTDAQIRNANPRTCDQIADLITTLCGECRGDD